MPSDNSPENHPAFTNIGPGRLIGRGHTAGDFLQAYDWVVTEEREQFLRVEAEIPEHCLNPRQELFGGFTPTYIDLLTVLTVRAGPHRLDPGRPRGWVVTVNMRVDYYEPILAGQIEMVGEVEHQRGKTCLVKVKLYQGGVLAAHGMTTVRATLPET